MGVNRNTVEIHINTLKAWWSLSEAEIRKAREHIAEQRKRSEYKKWSTNEYAQLLDELEALIDKTSLFDLYCTYTFTFLEKILCVEVSKCYDYYQKAYCIFIRSYEWVRLVLFKNVALLILD